MNNEHCLQIEYLDSVDSTNAYLKRKLLSGEPLPEPPFAAAAKEQTEGRGRSGRKWLNTEGALMMSVAVMLDDPSVEAPLASLAAACAAKKTIAALGCRASIKWPNDVVCIGVNGYKKLCGILCELVRLPDGRWFAILGIGVNVNADAIPENLLQPATSVFLETGRKTEISAAAAILFRSVCGYADLLKTDKNALLSNYRADCFTFGKSVRAIESSGNEIVGIAADIDSIGRLTILTETGEKITVSAADVSLRLK